VAAAEGRPAAHDTTEEVSVPVRILRSSTVARAAVAGLTLGLAALASMALWSTTSTAQTTARVRDSDDISDRWGRAFVKLNTESEALADYLRAGDDIGRQPLLSAIGSVDVDLTWLETHGARDDVAQARSVHETYHAQTETLRLMVDAAARGDPAGVEAGAQQAALASASVRKQAVANSLRVHLELGEYLSEVDGRNQRLRMAGMAICAVDFLLVTLCGYVLVAHQRGIRRQALDSRHQAMHDSLTGIPNRALLGERIDQALEASDRDGEAVALLMLDLNRFKEVNDILGHHYGDLLLQQVAARVTGAVRDHDTVARVGGDEFAVLLPAVGSADLAMEVAGRVLSALERPADLDGMPVDVSGSLGVAVYPSPSVNGAELLQHADIAMYAAKRGLRGSVLYDPTANTHSSQQLTLLGELRDAIGAGELVLHYQPKVHAGTDRPSGVEALVRWRHPSRGLLGPGEFIPLAEQSDLILPLTDHVLAVALEQCRRWKATGTVLPVAVNLATRCLLDLGLPARVAALLAEHGVVPEHLTLEITESAVITDPERVGVVLAGLRDVGVRLSIDDFGTGYSSMSYLQTMPVHELKIDRMFISTLSLPRGRAIVRAILELGHALGLSVVAEGVEDEETTTALVAMGCDLIQGYHVCRPVPAAGIASWLAARTTVRS
jgi:diguanylate cyclase (GGDEF)-like protein